MSLNSHIPLRKLLSAYFVCSSPYRPTVSSSLNLPKRTRVRQGNSKGVMQRGRISNRKRQIEGQNEREKQRQNTDVERKNTQEQTCPERNESPTEERPTVVLTSMCSQVCAHKYVHDVWFSSHSELPLSPGFVYSPDSSVGSAGADSLMG